MQTGTQPRPLGMRLPPSARPGECWGQWTVVPRTNGFHVSRESANGTRTEALLNDVGRTKVFRRRELAQAACDRANAQRGFITLDAFFANLVLACLIAAALCWVGPALEGDEPARAHISGAALAAAAGREEDNRLCRRMHGPDAAALHLPDGQHRCTDSQGRRLSPRSGIVLVHEVQP